MAVEASAGNEAELISARKHSQITSKNGVGQREHLARAMTAFLNVGKRASTKFRHGAPFQEFQ
jgi:hypothetical protein